MSTRGSRKANGKTGRPADATAAPKRKKLSFKDQRDWDTIESRIAGTEGKLAALEAELSLPAVVTDGTRLLALQAEMDGVRREIDQLYARWAELESQQT
jgi:ATP-binding cassette subfamily F protein uup